MVCIYLWLLLCQAMDRTHAPDERLAIDRNHAAVAKHALQSFDCAAVVGVAKHGQQH